jgi:Protein of unknown function (DUF1573).
MLTTNTEIIHLGNFQGNELSFTFDVINSGNTARITKLSASCGCTTPTIDKYELQPGEKATVLQKQT